MDLDRIYRQEIRKDMEQKTLSSGKQKIAEDRFQWFLLPSVLFMTLAMGLRSVDSGWKNKGGV